MKARRRALAFLYGMVCHGLFILAVSVMVRGLLRGMENGLGRLEGTGALIGNAFLLAQFPLLHSLLLGRRGRRVLTRLAPADLGPTLAPTTYALIAALQISITFLLWSPSGILLWRPQGTLEILHRTAFVGAWIFLGKALFDAGLGLQTGWIGWTSAWRGRTLRYPDLPRTGLFARCRQPIYLGFALILWTGPVWTLDHLALALAWSIYCGLGPLHKERSFLAMYGEAFAAYRSRTPYLFPRLLP